VPAYAVESIITSGVAAERMTLAVMATARAIANESTSTANHAERLAWAQRMAKDAEARREVALGMLALATGAPAFQSAAAAGTDLAEAPFSLFSDEAATTVNLFARASA
jgi:hypothetical protein